MTVFEKQVNVQCGISMSSAVFSAVCISMLISSHFHNAANASFQRTSGKATSKKIRISLFVTNNRVQ